MKNGCGIWGYEGGVGEIGVCLALGENIVEIVGLEIEAANSLLFDAEFLSCFRRVIFASPY